MQKFYTRRKKLARKAAAFMSAVMLFSSEAGIFMQDMAYVSAADDEAEDGNVQAEETPEDKGAAVTNAADGDFSVTVGELQYGEDGSNAAGNLDAIFAPKLVVDGAELVNGTDYTVSYKFFADKAAAEAITKESFDEAEGIELSKVNAGTEVYAVIKAVAADAEYLVSAELTVAKRVISLSYEAAAENAIEGRDVAEDGSYVIAEADVDYSGFNLDIADGFAYSLDAEALLAGDVVLDLSDVDLSVDSFDSVPMNVELDPEFNDNFELDKNIHGDYYVTKAQYYVVFMANNNGETMIKKYAFPSYDYNDTAVELLKKLGKTEEVFSADGEEYTLGGFLDTETESLVGWTAYVDGFNASRARDYTDYSSGDSYSTIIVNADASTYESYGTKKTLKLKGKRDYLFVAEISKAAADNIYVSVIPSVFYDTRAHVAIGSKAKGKKEVADLRVKVNYAYEGSKGDVDRYTELTQGTDYTIAYYNNTDASMSVSEDGTYAPVKTGADRPHVVITGKGRYKGFEATVYFDILPVNMGAYEYAYAFLKEENSDSTDGFNYDSMDYPYIRIYSSPAYVSGISKSTYVLKNGKISGINPKLTKSFDTRDQNYRYTYATVSLTKGKDYNIEIYKWNDTGVCWDRVEGVDDPNKLTEAGDYLCLFRGTGNYCGAVFGGTYNEFCDGKTEGTKVNPNRDCTSSYQFHIADSMDYDMSTAKISIGVKKVAWDGIARNSASFNIVVKNKKNQVLEYGKDYYVYFSNKYSNRNGSNSGESITASNQYTVSVYGIGEYRGKKTGGKITIKGTKLNKKWFTLNSSHSFEITEAGKAAGITTDSSSPYYVNYRTRYVNSNKRIVEIGGGYYSGQALDPASKVKLSYSVEKVKKISLKDAIKNGYVRFEISANGVYNVKGAMPDYIKQYSGNSTYPNRTVNCGELYSGYIMYGVSIVDGNGYYRNADLKITVKNNTKLGNTAKVTANVIYSDFVTGSADIGTFTVGTCSVDGIYSFSNFMPDLYDEGFGTSELFAVVTDAQKSKGSLDKPNVKLYQVYRDKYGALMAAAVNSKQYTVNAGTKWGTKDIAIDTYLTNGSMAGFDFKAVYNDAGVYSGIFALYNTTLNVKEVAAVKIEGTEYPVSNGAVDKSFAPVFRGVSINPFFTGLKLPNAELNLAEDYDLVYGDNIAAGSKTGIVVFRAHYNKAEDTYEYGGFVSLYYDIASADAITL